MVTDVNTGCTDTAYVTITEPTPVTVTASNDVTICIGGNTNISANAAGGTPGYTYVWDNGLPNGQQHNVAPGTTTTYTVYALDANGCQSPNDMVTVTLYPALNVVASQDDSICPGQFTIISANGGGGNGGPYTYTWNNGLGNGQQQNVSPASTTTYIVTISDNCSPSVSDTVTVVVNPTPAPLFSADTLQGCEPLTITFYNNTAANMNGSSVWSFGDGSGANNLDTVTHTFVNPGSYDVSLTITSPNNQGGCTGTNTINNYINVWPLPTADFTMSPNPADALNPLVAFFDQSYTNIVAWDWNLGGLASSNLQNPTYSFPEDTGTYNIVLTVTDANGCVNSTTEVLVVKGAYALYVPNAFTPNDGDGLNDYFMPKHVGIADRDFEFYVFDRWGEVIYFTPHKDDKGWDGTYKGKAVKNDVYVWKIFFKDINGESHSAIGKVTIIR
ncbi:MAG: hypothetical protein Kow0079_06060 [Vicingaceae bacterium]